MSQLQAPPIPKPSSVIPNRNRAGVEPVLLQSKGAAPAGVLVRPSPPQPSGPVAAVPGRVVTGPQYLPLPCNPVLRFTPTAWAKLQFLLLAGQTEVGGFGVTSPDDLLLVTDFYTVQQDTTSVSVKFDDEAVANYFDDRVDEGRQPQEFGRIWIHTHPGDSPHPSHVDEQTFIRVFGSCDWAIMAIVARGCQTYARLRFNTGPGASIEIPVKVDFKQPFTGSDQEAWATEYLLNIHPQEWGYEGLASQIPGKRSKKNRRDRKDTSGFGAKDDARFGAAEEFGAGGAYFGELEDVRQVLAEQSLEAAFGGGDGEAWREGE